MAIHDIYSGRDYRGRLAPSVDDRFDEDALHRDLDRASAGDDGGGIHGRTGEPRGGVLGVIWRRKLIVALMLFLCGATGVTYVALAPPRYQATAAMLIDPRLGKSVGGDPNTPGFIADSAAIDSQIKLFTAQTVLARVAAQAKLAADPEFNGSQRSLLQRLLHSNAVLDGGVDLLALEEAITIKRPERTYVVEIDVLARDAGRAATIANDLTQAYIDDQVSSRVGATRDDTAYVSGKLDALSGQIKGLDDKIEAFKIKNKIIEATGLRFNEQQVADLTRTLGEARAKMSDAKAKSDEIVALAKRGRLDGSSEALKSLTMERLRQQQAETEQNVARLAQTLGSRHPEMREATERQIKIRALIVAELQRLRTSVQGDFQVARANEAQIQASLDKLKSQASRLSQSLVPLDQLERNRAVLRASFDRFAQVNGSLAQQEAGSPPGRVIAVARPPVSPASPKKTAVGLAALSSGLFLGVVGALLAEGSSAPPRRAPPDLETSERPRRRYWADDEIT